MLRRAGCLSVAVALLPLIPGHVALAAPPECKVVSSSGRCLVAALDPGRPGGASRRSPSEGAAEQGASGSRPARNGGAAQSERGTTEQGVNPLPAPVDPGVRGIGNGVAFGTGAQGGPTQIDPAGPARLAISQLDLSGPVIRMSTVDRGFVGVPIWLWIDRGAAFTGPTSATAAVGDAEVTATGRILSVEWDMGPSGDIVVCDGPGTPWRGQPGPSPDCGYLYTLRSLPERTGGTGRWPIVATSVWQVDWAGVSGGAPVAGQQTVRVSTDTSLSVGEVQVLISGGGS